MSDDGGSVTGTATVSINNVIPVVETPVVNPSPSDEAESVIASASFTGAASSTCTVDYGEGDGPQDGTVESGVCTGPAHIYQDDGQSGTASAEYTITIVVTDDDNESGENSVVHTVNNLAPVIDSVTNDGPIDENSSVAITVAAADPGSLDTIVYEFDCDGDGSYEIGPQAENSTTCLFEDNGDFTVNTRVIDDDTGAATSSTVVTVNNVAPAVSSAVVSPSPSNEGQSVVAGASFSDPGPLDTHSCTVDYGDGSGPQPGTVDGPTCTGPAHTYVDDDPSGTSSDDYTVTITVTDDDNGSDAASVSQTVQNVAPTITSITTNAPVPQGEPIVVTVEAGDPGIADTLLYSFDCENDGVFEIGPQAEPEVSCTFADSVAFPEIGVRVSDDDLGIDEQTVIAGQTVTLCGNYYTGEISAPRGSACPSGTAQLVLPAATTATTLCLNPYTGAMNWKPAGGCGIGYLTHLVPDSGPLGFCQNLYTGKLRYSMTGQCGTTERAGVIPG